MVNKLYDLAVMQEQTPDSIRAHYQALSRRRRGLYRLRELRTEMSLRCSGDRADGEGETAPPGLTAV